MSAGRDPGAGRPPLARRLLQRLLPDDPWSREFLEELDAELAAQVERRSAWGSDVREGLWWTRQALSWRTVHFVWLMRRRRRDENRAEGEMGTKRGGIGWLLSDSSLDVRHALRLLVREPRTALLIALTLALGIGSIAAMYGVADRLFLRGPRHVLAHEQLTRLLLRFDDAGGERTSPWIPLNTVRAVQEGVRGLSATTYYRFDERLARFGADVGLVRVSEVDGRYFDVLGPAPAAGRFFGPEGVDGEGGPAVVSHARASAAYGSPAAAVGRTLDLAGVPRTVVAVAPEGFAGPHLERVDVWVPIHERFAGGRNWWVVGRVAGGPATEDVRTRLAAEAQAVHDRTDPGRFFQWAVEGRVVLAPVTASESGEPSAEASIARLLLAVVSLVLLIACANVVNLLLARITRRKTEVVVRLALGSGRWRLLRLLLAESLLLGLAGGMLSVPVAYMGGAVLRNVLLPQVAWTSSPVDGGALLVTAALAVLTGVLVGLLPARLANRTELSSGLTSGRTSASRGRVRTHVALATAQVALSATLLLGAGLFVKSFWTIRLTDLGVEAEEVFTVGLRSLDSEALGHGAGDEAAVYRRALERVRGVAGAERAALAVGLPFWSSFGTSVHVPGMDSIPQLPGGGPYVAAVTDRYFDAVGTRLLRGSAITAEHVARGERVVVVSETMARLVWPDSEPLGACVHVGRQAGECSTVVGVAQDVHQQGYREPQSMQLYIPLGTELGFSGLTLAVRPTGGAPVQRIGAALEGLDPAVHFVDIARLASTLEAEVRPWRLGAVVLSLTSVLAALVSLLGVYGVLSYLVAERRREIGVRMALGASRSSIRRLVVRTGLLAGLVGVVLGFGLVLGGGRWIGPLLFETSVADPWVMSLVGSLLVGAAVLACLLPAMHASRIAPVDCLRGEG